MNAAGRWFITTPVVYNYEQSFKDLTNKGLTSICYVNVIIILYTKMKWIDHIQERENKAHTYW